MVLDKGQRKRKAGQRENKKKKHKEQKHNTGSTKMMKSSAAVKVRTKAGEKVNVSTEVNKAAIVTLAVAAGLVGAWVITAFVAGMMASGGLVPMISNWIQAVIG
ncbi:MAG: hypothetical protein ACYDBT_16980 [Desulfobulbaceae bacterium]